MSRPPGAGRRLPPPSVGPSQTAHVDVSSVHLSDVSGPPAPAQRAPDAPLAGPTSRPAPGGTSGGPDQPAQKAPGVLQGGGRKSGPGPVGRA